MFENDDDLPIIQHESLQKMEENQDIKLLKTFEKEIREECKGAYMDVARDLFQLKYYDHAVLEYWNRSMTDLKDKLTIYGLEHFPSELNLKINTREDISKVRDSEIIEGSYLLGIIDDEAYIFLNHCLAVRNNFTAAHDTKSPIDPMEALNLIKNCVKYVLQRDVPSPAMTINDLLQYIQSENFDKQHFKEIIKDQSPKIIDSFLRRIFNEYIDSQSQKEYRDNLKYIVKDVWDIVGEEIKSKMGQKLMQLKLEDEVDKSLYAMDFMLQVQGIKYIPQTVRKHIFIKKSNELLEAHRGMNNFYTEIIHAKELKELGFNIPDESMPAYIQAVTFSYTGNPWGTSDGAHPYNQSMIENLSTKGIEVLLESLEKDVSYAWHFTNEKSIKMLINLLEILKDKSNLLPKHKTKIESFLKMQSIKNYFTEKLDE